MPGPVSGGRPASSTPSSSGKAPDAPSVTGAELRAALQAAGDLPPGLRRAADAALAAAGNGPVSLAFLDAQGKAGATLKAQLTTPSKPESADAEPKGWGAPKSPGQSWGTASPARAQARATPAPGTGTTTDSLLNSAGRGNVSGANPVLNQIPGLTTGNPDLSRLRLDDRNAVQDPNTVARQAPYGGSAVQAIRGIVESGSPKGAELIANELASRFGGFTAANTPQNRAAILDALNWLTDTNQGLRYDHPRASSSDPTTQSPNQTVATRAGVCRDIHTAAAAILASLMNAHPDASGKMVPGSPNGREGDVQSIGFNNPTEYHDFMVYRDPGTGKWNSLEYDKRYELGAATAVDAMRQTTGSLTGITRYTINGWDGKPIVNSRGAVDAARSNAFMSEDPGVGQKGEIRTVAGESQVGVTGFLTKNVSFSAQVDPSALANGLRGGVKVNYHRDFETVDTKGYLRVAGGVTTDFADSSKYTGLRGEGDRARFQTYVLAIKVDGRLEGKERELLKNHLKATWGVDLDALGGLPINSGGGTLSIPVGAIGDYSKFDVGADGGLSGHEQLSKNLTLDWAVRARAQVDVINAATELTTSQGTSAERSLLKDPARAEVALALTHTSDSGLVTRFEAGGTTLLGSPLDKETNASEVHQAVLTVSPSSGLVNFGLVAKGETIDHKFIPVNSLGVAVNLNPSKNVSIGVGASSVFQDGNIRNIGQNVQVMGNLSIRF